MTDERIEERVAEVRRAMGAAGAGGLQGGDYIAVIVHAAPMLLDLAAEALRLRVLIPLARNYARQNPRHFYDGQVQDPYGVHGVLEAIDAALSPRGENEETK